MATEAVKDALRAEIDRLEKKRDELEAILPAHSVQPHQLARIEEVEELIEEKKKELEALT